MLVLVIRLHKFKKTMKACCCRFVLSVIGYDQSSYADCLREVPIYEYYFREYGTTINKTNFSYVCIHLTTRGTRVLLHNINKFVPIFKSKGTNVFIVVKKIIRPLDAHMGKV